MGLSIHYSGRIKDMALVSQLTEVVQEVCTILSWRCRTTKDEKLTGVSFTPPECESVGLTFLPNGELVCKAFLLYDIHPATTVSVKTQYAGMEVHMAVIKLLKHLAKQYFSVFKLRDEGGYWETGDEEVLRENFRAYNKMLNVVHAAMMDFKAEVGDTPERMTDRLEKFLRARWKK